jgi:putative ABC transport system permease protein
MLQPHEHCDRDIFQAIKGNRIRKVMGSKRTQLILQFISETTAICFFALLLGIGLADLLIEGWNVMTMDMLRLSHNYLDTPIFLFSIDIYRSFGRKLSGFLHQQIQAGYHP